MTPHDLIAAFEALAEAPDGVVRLRELILQLAVRGKLVPQDPDDEPASKLLLCARAALASRAREVRSGRWEPSSPIVEAEVPYALPAGWVWARINDTAIYVNGMAFKHSQWGDTGLPIIRIQNLTDPRKPFNYAECDSADSVLVHSGDILVSWSATLEAFIWSGGDALLNQHIFRVDPCVQLLEKPFLYWLLRQAIREMAEGVHAHGLVMTHINRGPFLAHVAGIPPLAEQQRIIARVDELMGLLDRLDVARSSGEVTRAFARDSTLASLRQADTPEEVEVAWNRFAERMDELVIDPTDIAPLRQTVLELAVRGRLVTQDPNDEPARVLLERAAAERGELVRAGQLRRREPRQEGASPAVPFTLPSGWTGARFPDVAVWAVGSGFPLRSQGHTDLPYRFCKVSDMNRPGNERYIKTTAHTIDDAIRAEIRANIHPAGTVVFPKIGGAIATNKRRVLVDPTAIDNNCLGLTPFPSINSEWLYLLLSSIDLSAYQAGTSLPALNQGTLEQIWFGLPPLPEQHRIVVRVEELMGLLDHLEQRLATARATHAAFAAAAVHHLDA